MFDRCADAGFSRSDLDNLEPAPTASGAYSFSDLCVSLYEEMTNFARRMTGGDVDRAGDVVQEAYKKALKAWPRWRPETDNPYVDARAWLYRIVSNTYLKDYHRVRRVRAHGEDSRDEIMQGTYGRVVEEDLRDRVDSPFGDEVAAALGALTDDHRAVMELCYVEGLGCGAIAKRLNVPKGTVYSRIARAHAALEAALADFADAQYGYRRRVPRAPRGASRGRVDLSKTPERVKPKARGIDCVVAGNDDEALEGAQSAVD